MKKSIDEHAARFDEVAAEYDDEHNQTDEYRACVSLVLDHARDALSGTETVLDVGCGTGAIGLSLAEDAGSVVFRDISEGMLDEARRKADEAGLENVAFGEGTFREPTYDDEVDVVVSNFAMHHLSDEEKREAIDVLGSLGPDRIVLGDVMFFGEPDPAEPFYSPEVDDPSTVGHLADCFTDAGYALIAVEPVHDQVGVLVGERV
ncbi:class I SAM-dependent methyltransferase [Haloarchaeobius iranensis]|uniref:Methyltransferase domain-containing protein n=1 Tax=Haloarchaeobius iranensis TaxID=996166 RepID=A0A1G9UIL5_9EURY|nr:class I SAM-dependent methyltransferase [Haloarchaeobius iranensis]SDM59693.1 Methyltransferase domain-containing protein [Haloarchaeobius iranensis]